MRGAARLAARAAPGRDDPPRFDELIGPESDAAGTTLIGGSNVGFNPGSAWHLIPQHHDLV